MRALKGPRICTSGTATADKLASYGIKVDLIPREFRADAVVASLLALGSMAGVRAVPRANVTKVIGEQLREAGAVVTEVVAYRTILEDAQREGNANIYGMLLDGRIDVATFTSPSAIRNFAKIRGQDQVADLLKNAVGPQQRIGPVTADAARQLGIPVTIQPKTYTVPALVDAIAARSCTQGSGLENGLRPRQRRFCNGPRTAIIGYQCSRRRPLDFSANPRCRRAAQRLLRHGRMSECPEANASSRPPWREAHLRRLRAAFPTTGSGTS